MASAKVENYSAEQTATVVGLYEGGKGQTVETIAEAVGKSARSVIAKLSREGVYVAKTGKTAKARVTKADLVAKVAEALGISKEALATLEKGSHEALESLEAAVYLMKREAEYDTAQEEYDSFDSAGV